MRKLQLIVFPVLALVTLASCMNLVSPLGRGQFTLLSDEEIDALGAKSFEEVKRDTPFHPNPKVLEYVQCVANPLIKEVGRSEIYSSQLASGSQPEGGGQESYRRMSGKTEDWEIKVFGLNEANAFAIAGRKIGVYHGMFKVAQTDAQLAAVLAHEIGHVSARHSSESLTRQILANGLLVAADALLQALEVIESDKQEDQANRQVILGALGLGLYAGYTAPHGRDQETEADVVGLKLMAAAGYDPNEAVKLWENMEKMEGSWIPEFISTHPSHSTRIDSLKKQLPEAMKIYRARTSANSSVGGSRCVRPAGLEKSLPVISRMH